MENKTEFLKPNQARNFYTFSLHSNLYLMPHLYHQLWIVLEQGERGPLNCYDLLEEIVKKYVKKQVLLFTL